MNSKEFEDLLNAVPPCLHAFDCEYSSCREKSTPRRCPCTCGAEQTMLELSLSSGGTMHDALMIIERLVDRWAHRGEK